MDVFTSLVCHLAISREILSQLFDNVTAHGWFSEMYI